MARARGGNTGFAVALVIFGCGFVIATLVAIIFYTKIETAEGDRDKAVADLAKYVKPAETGPANDYVSPGTSVYANMAARINELQDELTKSSESAAKLEGQRQNQEALFAAQLTETEKAKDALAAEREQYNAIMGQRQEKIDELIQQKDDLVGQIAELQKKVSDSIRNADEAAQQRIAELNTQLETVQASLSQAQGQASEWQRKYELLFASLPTPPNPDTTLPDGEVASVFGNGRNLFITLGRNNGLVMGMTFEVYDPDPILRLSTTGEARGKATVEVYSLEGESATCRVVRRDRSAVIEPGDPIVNLGYDPNMEISFHVFGQFDIEYDGGPNDIERIKTLAKATTAQIADLALDEQGEPILTPDVDYIVLGARPVLPEAPDPNEFDPEKLERYRKALADNEAYFRLVDEAKILRIPVLNQDRFLDLIGYYVR